MLEDGSSSNAHIRIHVRTLCCACNCVIQLIVGTATDSTGDVQRDQSIIVCEDTGDDERAPVSNVALVNLCLRTISKAFAPAILMTHS